MPAQPPNCPFCHPPSQSVILSRDLGFAMWDGFPVNNGHALIIPKRHIGSLGETTPEERILLFDLLDEVRLKVVERYHPDGFNIGINEGTAAGQTVAHLHIHLIPRYGGDVSDPTGGVRGVIPNKANYRRGQKAVDHGDAAQEAPHDAAVITGGEDALLPHLQAHIDLARDIDIAVAFTMVSGLNLIEDHLRDLLNRKGQLRFLTGDYLDATEPGALHRLLDLKESYPDQVELRAFETQKQGFHPKTYLFHARNAQGVALVGSSNLSKMGLTDSVEWNYRVITSREPVGFGHVLDAYVRLFEHPDTTLLTREWVQSYEARRKRPVVHQVPEETPEPPPNPHVVQEEALKALRETRTNGNQSGLVVLATGLGKTWLSAFDSVNFDRVLFIAHREEILDQAMRTFRRIRPTAYLGKYTGKEKEIEADVLFASIQTLSRLTHLRNFAQDDFDYIVMDEFHHASAQTYRRVIDHFHPKFLLGLTATPDRTDGGDLLSLCNQNLVYRCDIPEGIQHRLLCPFHYYGVPDEVDYENIPWRSKRFDEEELTQALATQARADNALEQLHKRGGDRTLAFCCSTRHADFMSGYFNKAGVKAVAVHSADGSAPRSASLKRLEEGEVEVIFSVDMFNEGVDLPNVDTILMLRPTESMLLWLQQFGRGLRQPEKKDKTLKVIDYIGNHRIFLNKPQALLHGLFDMGPGNEPVRAHFERIQAGTAELPPGCAVTYDTQAIDLLRQLFPKKKNHGTVFYTSFRENHGRRPLASETYQEGYDPVVLGQGHGGWFHFVDAMDDLDQTHKTLMTGPAGRFLSNLDKTQMSKSYKMLLLRAMLRQHALPGALSIDDLSKGFAAEAARNQYLRDDVSENLDDHRAVKKLVESNPVKAWIGAKGTGNESFFTYEEGVFRCNLEIPNNQLDAFRELVSEMIEWRIAKYLDRAHLSNNVRSIECRVSHNTSGNPILFLPDRNKQKDIPQGTTSVTIDTVAYEAEFQKIAVNVLHREESQENMLPSILREWFGADAGAAGTVHRVVFIRDADGYRLEPRVTNSSGPELWKTYMREKIPPLFGLQFTQGLWRQGFVLKDNHIFLLVTLEKQGLQENFNYDDRFLSPTEFQWQSQNQTTTNSKAGYAIQNHETEGIPVHLFVRPTKLLGGKAAPFYYCGELAFVSWEGNKPITVLWSLQQGVPSSIRGLFELE